MLLYYIEIGWGKYYEDFRSQTILFREEAAAKALAEKLLALTEPAREQCMDSLTEEDFRKVCAFLEIFGVRPQNDNLLVSSIGTQRVF